MQQPIHQLVFTMSYPQFRDYYLYTIRDQKKGSLTPKVFLLAAVGVGGVALFLEKGLPGTWVQPFLWVFSVLTSAAVLGYFFYRFFLYLQVRQNVRRIYRLDRIGKGACRLALYENYFTIHYPTMAFDGLYGDIKSTDRTEKMTVFCLNSGAMVPIPNTALTGEITREMSKTAGNAVLADPEEGGFLPK